MQLIEIEMTVRDASAAATFYRETLDLPVAVGDERTEVSVGRSTLILVQGPTGPGSHHLAITVPAAQFASAKRWLIERVPLLQRQGVDEFSLPPPWRSQSIYFLGPEDVLLELIARHDLDAGGTHSFTTVDLIGISEVGIAVDDVEAASAALHATFGLEDFDSGGPGFTPVGDHHGLLVVVGTRRAWFPTTGLSPSRDALVVTLDPGPGRSGPSLLLGSCLLRSAGS